MTALLFGGLTALVWATGAITSSRSARRVGPLRTLSWVMLVGLVLAVPLAVWAGTPRGGLHAGTIVWLALAGATNVAGLGCSYAAFARGHVGVVAALVSTEGALAAALSILAGERPGPWTLVGLGLATVGVAFVASGTRATSTPDAGDGRATAVLLAMVAALMFGVTLYASGHVSSQVPAGWVALPARVVGVAAVLGALPFGVRPGRPSRRLHWAAVTGVLEVVGLVCFALGARDSIAVTSVVGSQFSALAAVGAFLIDGERLSPRQIGGIAWIAVGVAVVAGTA
ncbi:MAG: DMT family transporter [Thermoleophilia bacterium]